MKDNMNEIKGNETDLNINQEKLLDELDQQLKTTLLERDKEFKKIISATFLTALLQNPSVFTQYYIKENDTDNVGFNRFIVNHSTKIADMFISKFNGNNTENQ